MANYKKWNLTLTSPSGETFDMGDMGLASSGQEHGFVLGGIIKFLEESNFTQREREFVLADPIQMLLNNSFHQWHGYRLAWGGGSPEEEFSGYPDGVALDWQFYRLINGKTELLLEGTLPSNWWAIDQDDRHRLLEIKIRDEEEASAA